MRPSPKIAGFLLWGLVFLSACQKPSDYPTGVCHLGQKSYQGGALEPWQQEVRRRLVDLLGMKKNLLSQEKPHRVQLRIEKTPLTNTARQMIGKQKNICVREEKSFAVLSDCQNPSSTIRLYHISYQAIDGRRLFAFMLVPADYWSEPIRQEERVPTLIFLHGHGKTKEDVVFDPVGDMNLVAYEAARTGALVLVPDQRGFGESRGLLPHRQEAWLLKKQGGSFLGAQVMDMVATQNVLERVDLKVFGVKQSVDLSQSTIAGLSFGGYVALFAGALDLRFDTISTQAHFLPFEILFTQHHCSCQQVPSLQKEINIFDVALLVFPRRLFISAGGQDTFSNGYLFSALDLLLSAAQKAGVSVGLGPQDDVLRERYKDRVFDSTGDIVLEVKQKAGHEVMSREWK